MDDSIALSSQHHTFLKTSLGSGSGGSSSGGIVWVLILVVVVVIIVVIVIVVVVVTLTLLRQYFTSISKGHNFISTMFFEDIKFTFYCCGGSGGCSSDGSSSCKYKDNTNTYNNSSNTHQL